MGNTGLHAAKNLGVQRTQSFVVTSGAAFPPVASPAECWLLP